MIRRNKIAVVISIVIGLFGNYLIYKDFLPGGERYKEYLKTPSVPKREISIGDGYIAELDSTFRCVREPHLYNLVIKDSTNYPQIIAKDYNRDSIIDTAYINENLDPRLKKFTSKEELSKIERKLLDIK